MIIKNVYSKTALSRRLKNILILLITVFVFSFGWLTVKTIYRYNHLTLQSTWQSQETGSILTFSKDGKVLDENFLLIGTYHIISHNQLEYTVGEKTFKMIYKIEQNRLYWGMSNDTLEIYNWVNK